MGKFKQGESGNLAGRPKGVKNKSTDQLRQTLNEFIDKNISGLQSDFDKLQPVQRLQMLDKLLRHVLPAPMNELENLTDESLDKLIEKLRHERVNVN
jgi:hypothetical protein